MMRVRITPGAALFWGVLCLERGGAFFAVLLAAAWHEVGHLAAARALGIRLRLFEWDVCGARIVPQGALPSYRSEAALAAAGPAASLLLAVFLLPFGGIFGKTMWAATLAFALFNLLPVAGFDGGRVLSALLHTACGARAAPRVLAVTSYLSLLFLFSLSACLLLRLGQSMTLAVLSASLFARLFLKQDR